MSSLELAINVLMVLTVLSVAAERVTDVVKLRRNGVWRGLPDDARRLRITSVSVVAGIVIAVATKADLFAMLARPEAPWSTLGWVRADGSGWVRHATAAGGSGLIQALWVPSSPGCHSVSARSPGTTSWASCSSCAT